MTTNAWIVRSMIVVGAGAILTAGCDGSSAATPDAAEDGATAADAPIDAPAPTLGTVTPVAGACPAGPIANTTCQLVDVACPGVATMRAAVRVTAPTGTQAGTVLFGTGGGGASFYDGNATAAAMMTQLAGAGFRLVQRRWEQQPNGWLTGPGGMRALSCRYATLATWAHTELHGASTATGFCATGNSGGSTEVAYALAAWGRGDILDLAVPSGGPPMGRIDHGCLDGADPTWQAECAALVPGGASSCTAGAGISCSYSMGARQLIDAAWSPATPCAQSEVTFRSTFLDDSVAAPAAVLDYPNTKVDFLYGADDCTEAVTLGLAYATTVTSAKTLQFVPSTPHAVFSSVAGARAIHDAIVADCVPR